MATRAKTKQTAFGERIVSDPQVEGGAPLVQGTRVPVERLLAQLAAKPDIADVLALYPELTIEDMQAVFAYAYTAVQAQVRSGQPFPEPGPEDIWANYDPAKVREALKRSAGVLHGTDAEKFLAYLREMRGHEPTESPE